MYNPAFNLASEEIFCDLCALSKFEGCFFLWQNEPAVILGRFNNIHDEIDINFARGNNIKIVRRNSGGGAVYHDLGNVNYSFILHDRKIYNLKFFADIIINSLMKIGINGTLEFNHNDLLVNNYKFSGMAQFHRNNILLHHGTLLFDSDLRVIHKVLRRSDPAKKVINLKNFLKRDINIQEFMTLLCDIICGQESLKFFAQHDINENISQDNLLPDKNFQASPDSSRDNSGQENIKFRDTRFQDSKTLLHGPGNQDSINFFMQRDISQDTIQFASQHDTSSKILHDNLLPDKNLRYISGISQDIFKREYIKFFAGDNIDLSEINNNINKLMLAKYLDSNWTLKGEYNNARIQE